MTTYHHQLNTIVNKATIRINEIPDQEFNHKPFPSKWSKKEVLGHLIDSAYNNHQRFLRAATQGDMIFQGYDQDDWVIRNNYQNRDREEILSTWITVHQHLSHLIEGLPAELLTRKTDKHNFHQVAMNTLQEGEPTSLSYLVWDYLFHQEHHLAQIIPNYQRTIKEFVE